jgi:hypothetical protein
MVYLTQPSPFTVTARKLGRLRLHLRIDARILSMHQYLTKHLPEGSSHYIDVTAAWAIIAPTFQASVVCHTGWSESLVCNMYY